MHWQPAKFYTQNANGITCTLCPFACRFAEGDTGHCHVRRRRGHLLETATMATSVRHLHAIERKPFYHFMPGLQVLTLAAPGCTFRCSYCQNYRLSQFGRDQAAAMAAAIATPIDPAELVVEAQSMAAGIAFSYSEPVLASELTMTIAPLAKAAGVPIIWKSNGFITPQAAAELAAYIDAVNIDIKTADDDDHRRLTGAPLQPIWDAIAVWARAGVWIEISTPLIPDFNTSPASIRTLAQAVAAIDNRRGHTPWHLLRFHPDYRYTDAPPTHPQTLRTACDIAEHEGLAYVYVERALDDRGRNTYCHHCHSEIMTRDIWALGQQRIEDGHCPSCRTPIPGHWRRQRIEP